MDASDLIRYKSVLTTKVIDDKPRVWDIIRSKWIVITPEEIVRQCLVHYLIQDRQYGRGLIAVEKQIKYHQLRKRFDIVVYDSTTQPQLLIECKAPDQSISQSAIEQLLTYQEILGAQYIWLSNGHENKIYHCHENDYTAIDAVPVASL